MANSINITADIRGAQDALSGTAKSLPAIQKKVLNIVAKTTLKAVKTTYKATLVPQSQIHYQRTGELLRAFKKSVKGSNANVFPRAVSGGKNWAMGIACILNYGAKNGIKPRGFIQAGEAFAESGAYMNEVEKMVENELNKYWG